MNEEYIKKLFQQTGLDDSYYESFKKDISSNPEYNKKVFESIGLDESYYESFKSDTGLSTPVKKKGNTDLVSTSQEEDTASTTSPKQPSTSLDLSEKDDEFVLNKAPELQDGVKPIQQKYKEYKSSISIPEETKEEVRQSVISKSKNINKDWEELSVWDRLKSHANYLIQGISGEDFDQKKGEFQTESNYLQDELKTARQVLESKYKDESKPENFDELVLNQAIELKTNKELDKIKETKSRHFLRELPTEEREALVDFGENNIYEKEAEIAETQEESNFIYNSLKNKSKDYLKQVEELIKEGEFISNQSYTDDYIAENPEVLQEAQSKLGNISKKFEELSQQALEDGLEIELLESGINVRYSEESKKKLYENAEKILNSQTELGTFKEEVDLFDRAYGFIPSTFGSLGASTVSLFGGVLSSEKMLKQELTGGIGSLFFPDVDMNLVDELAKKAVSASDPLSKKSIEQSKELEEDIRGSIQKPITSSEAEGLYDWLTWSGVTLAETAPSMGAIMANPVMGSTIVGLGSAGQQYEQLLEEEKQTGQRYEGWQRFFTSVGSGGLEVALAQLPTALRARNLKRAYQASDKTKVGQTFVKRLFNSKTLKSAGSEVVEENGVTIGNNIMQKHILEKEDVGYFDGVGETTIASLFIGTLVPVSVKTSVKASNLVGDIQSNVKINKIENRLSEIDEKLKSGKISEETALILRGDVVNLLKLQKKEVEERASLLEKATSEEFEELKVIDKNISAYDNYAKKVASNPDFTRAEKKRIISDTNKAKKGEIDRKEGIISGLKDRKAQPQKVDENVVAENQEALLKDAENLNDTEVKVYNFNSLEEIPEQLRDKAKKVEASERETQIGFFGKKEKVTTRDDFYQLVLSGKDIRDSLQKQEVEQTQPDETVEEAIFGEDELADLEKQIEEEERKRQQEKDDEEKINKEKEKEGTISQNLNEKAYMNGKEGMIKILDSNKNTIVFETNDEIIDLGRKDEIENSFISDLGLSTMPPEGVNVTKLDSDTDIISVDGVDYTFIGRRRDKKGKAVVRVKEVESGLERRFVGEKAERILKDQSLKKPKNKPTIKLKQEGKEIPDAPKETKAEKRKKAVQAKEEAKVEEEIILEEELKKRTEKAEKDVKEFEEMLLEDAVSESSDKDLVQYKGNIFQVTKKKDGSFAVSQMRDDGKLVAVFESNPNRNKAIGIFKSKKTNAEKKALSEAENLISEYRKEQEDKILNWLEGVRNEVKKANKNQLNAIGLIPYAAEKALDLVITAYKGGKTMAEAIKIGYEYAKKQNNKITELDFKKFVLQQSKAPKQVKQPTQPPKQPKKPTQAPKKIDSKKETKQTKDRDKSIKKVKEKANTANNNYKKNRLGRFIPNSELDRALKVNVDNLSDEQLQEYESFLDKVNDVSFSYTENKSDLTKFASISDNQKPSEILGGEAKTKEKKLISEENKKSIAEMQKKSSKNVKNEDLPFFEKLKEIPISDFDGLSKNDGEILKQNINDAINGKNLNNKAKNIINELHSKNVRVKKVKDQIKGMSFRTRLTDKIYNLTGINKFVLRAGKMKQYLNYLARTPVKNLDNAIRGKKTGQLLNDLGITDLMSSIDRYSIDKTKGAGAKAVNLFYSSKKNRELSKKGYKDKTSLFSDSRLYLLFLENQYRNNKDDKKNFSPLEYVNATVATLRNDKDKNVNVDVRESMMKAYGVVDSRSSNKKADEILEAYNSLPKNEDGSIDIESALKNELVETEKQTYNLIEDYLRNEGLERSLSVATQDGKTVKFWDGYVPLFTRGKAKMSLEDVANEAENDFEGMGVGELQSLIERQGKLSPLDFNFVNNFSYHVDSVSRNFHMKPTIKAFSTVINALKNDKDLNETELDFVKAINENIKNIYIENYMSSRYTDDSVLEQTQNFIRKANYVRALGSGVRATTEIYTNLGNAMLLDSKSMSKGLAIMNSKSKKLSEEDLTFLMYWVGSINTSRLNSQSTSIRMEIEAGQSIKTSKDGNIFSKYNKLVDIGQDKLLAQPDIVVARPLWVGSFFNKFEQLTGKSIDLERLKTDREYAESIKEFAKQSNDFADDNVFQSLSSTNPMANASWSMLSKKNKKILAPFDKYLTRFQISEYSGLVKGWDALRGDRNEMSRAKGARLIGATLARMIAYNVGMRTTQGFVYSQIAGMFGYEDPYKEEDKKDFADLLYKETLSVFVQTLLMRRMGNIRKVGAAAVIEMLNANYGDRIGLREKGEKYNRYVNGLTFSFLDIGEAGNLKFDKYNQFKYMLNLFGAYSKSAKDLSDVLFTGSEWLFEESKNKKEVKEKREKALHDFTKLFISTSGIPMARDIGKLLMYDEAKKKGAKLNINLDMKNVDFPKAKFPDFKF